VSGSVNVAVLAGTVVNADMDGRDVEPSGVDACKRGGVAPVMSAATSMAKSTAGAKSAGRAERATAVGPRALEPNVAGNRHERVRPRMESRQRRERGRRHHQTVSANTVNVSPVGHCESRRMKSPCPLGRV
jgi:hypothetical protein